MHTRIGGFVFVVSMSLRVERTITLTAEYAKIYAEITEYTLKQSAKSAYLWLKYICVCLPPRAQI
jgi:hypothetical protein